MASNSRVKTTLDHQQSPDAPDSDTTTGDNNERDTTKSDSLWNRIQTSATTLMQDAVTRPSGAALGAELSHVLNNSSKASASVSSSSSSPGYSSLTSSSSLGLSHSTYSAETRASDGGLLSSFRSGLNRSLGHGKEEIGGGFEFDHLDQDSFRHDHDYYPDMLESQNKGKGKSLEFDNTLMMNNLHNFSEYEMAWINATRSDAGASFSSTSKECIQDLWNEVSTSQQQQHSYEEDRNDGAAVVTLLSDTFFQPGYMTAIDDNDPTSAFTSWNDYAEEDMTTDDGTYLTADEIRMIDSFRRQYSERDGQSRSGNRITSKSLIPDIDMFLAQNDTPATTSASHLRDEVLSHLPGTEDWVRVDERYHDEVWGYLRPALEAASTELEGKKKKKDFPMQGDSDGPAVRRLKMILRHMRQG